MSVNRDSGAVMSPKVAKQDCRASYGSSQRHRGVSSAYRATRHSYLLRGMVSGLKISSASSRVIRPP
jgi:hypothetical protein